MPVKGAIPDEGLVVHRQAGVLCDEGGRVLETGSFESLKNQPDVEIEHVDGERTLIPGFTDCHTHICFDGSRARDYALRVSGKSYLDIAKAGGGIWDTVTHTRSASAHTLLQSGLERALLHARRGVTTLEVKSGYGLNTEAELKMLRCIAEMSGMLPVDLIPTCLAAHMKPRDFNGSASEYLNHLLHELLPVVKAENLAGRVDIFIEDSAFTPAEAEPFLKAARAAGFGLTVHADQFTTGGSGAAVRHGALSADHLEASGQREIQDLAASNTVAVVLPGASLGLGMPYAPARQLLDGGACLAIASDWNPGSAPMGDLLTQACLIGASEKLSLAETLAGVTFRAARALGLTDRGQLVPGQLADFQAYPTSDYREIFYHQGQLKPDMVWKQGKRLA